MFALQSAPVVSAGKEYVCVNTPKKLHWLFQSLESAQAPVAVDIETNHATRKGATSPDPVTVIGMGFCWRRNLAAYIPLYSGTGDGTSTLWRDKKVLDALVERLAVFLENNHPKTLQNGKFDLQWIYRVMGIRVRGFDFDTMLAHYQLDEERRHCGHKLKEMGAHYIDPSVRVHEEALQKALEYYDPQFKRYSSVPLDIIYPYGCADVDITFQLRELFEPLLKRDNLDWLFSNMTMPLQQVCMMCELAGIPVDIVRLEQLRAEYDTECKEAAAKVYAALGYEFDIASSKQLVEILYNELKLPVQYAKKGGGITTDDDALDVLKDMHPMIPLLRDWRTVDKQRGTYIEGPWKRMDRNTNRIHADFKVHETDSGRLATENPNVQNMPRPENGGVRIKSIYAAPPGYKIVLADYRQIELKVAAHLSQEQAWIDAFNAPNGGIDLHSATAIKVFKLDCTPDEVKKKYEAKRTEAKCFHPDTEVLTRSGWKRIVDLAEGEEVVQATPGDNYAVKLEWVKPLEVFTKKHSAGELLHFKNNGIDLRVTPDHRMLTWGSTGKPTVVLAEAFGYRQGWANAGVLEGSREVDEALLRLAVAAQADGSVTGSKALRFRVKKDRKIARLRTLLVAAKVPYKEHVSSHGTHTFYIGTKNAADVLSLLDGKQLPWWWLDLTQKCREVILDEFPHWDGQTRGDCRMHAYVNTNQQSVNVLQALAAVTGRKTRRVLRKPCRKDYPKDCYVLTVRDRCSTTGGPRLARERLPFTDEVACISVPSTFVLVRDGGVPVICGQTINFGILYGQTAHGLAPKLKMTVEQAQQLIDEYFAGLPNLKAWLDRVKAYALEHGEVINPFGRRRRVPEINQYIPPRTYRPRGAPDCWGKKKEAPPIFKKMYADVDLKTHLHVFQGNQEIHQAAAREIGKLRNECTTCPHISTCILEAERQRRDHQVSELIRVVGNFMVQATATADISGMAFARVVREAARHGIPIALHPEERGIMPINIVHDELQFIVADEWVNPFSKLIDAVMTSMWPGCSVPLDTDREIVQRWSDKHTGPKFKDEDFPELEGFVIDLEPFEIPSLPYTALPRAVECGLMTYVAASRRYRPQRFSSVLGQAASVRVLQQAIKQNRIAPVYLFNGPKGTGKTTLARLLAKTLNCDDLPRQLKAGVEEPEPCCKCPSCARIAEGRDVEVLEMDAASHGGVDDIKEIHQIAQQQPRAGKWRVVILDEAHMLSNQAQNSLLKLFEEPPESFLPILCTTDPEKILATIRSRCSTFVLKPLPSALVRESVERIFSDAQQPITPDALATICSSSNGSLRDVQQIVDQLITSASGAEIDDEYIEKNAGLPSLRFYRRLARALSEAWETGPATWFAFVAEVYAEGFDMKILFYQALLYFIRDAHIALFSLDQPAPVTEYWTGIPHEKFCQNLCFTARDLDIMDQAWTEQEKLMGVGVHHRTIVEFWFLKTWHTRQFEAASTVVAG